MLLIIECNFLKLTVTVKVHDRGADLGDFLVYTDTQRLV